MQLDRNTTSPKRGKYALIKLRQSEITPERCCGPEIIPVETSAIDFGDTEDSDFFVIRLKDKYAAKALKAYAEAAAADDLQYADEVYELAYKASNHPNRRMPD